MNVVLRAYVEAQRWGEQVSEALVRGVEPTSKGGRNEPPFSALRRVTKGPKAEQPEL